MIENNAVLMVISTAEKRKTLCTLHGQEAAQFALSKSNQSSTHFAT